MIEAVSVGVFIKRERNIIELRSKKNLGRHVVHHRRRIASDRITRTIELARGYAYFVR